MLPKVILLGVVLLFLSISLFGYINPGTVWWFVAGFTSGVALIAGGINIRRCPRTLWHSLFTHWWARYCPICGAPLGSPYSEAEMQRAGTEWDEEKADKEAEDL